jgi:mono/diheme cytochrome c family protein
MKRLFVSSMLLALVGTISTYAMGQSAADTYKSKCQMCHGASGAGDTPAGKKVNAKDFHSADVQKMSDDDIAKAIKEGVKKDGKTVMQAYGGKLTDDQIKDLVKQVRELGKK